MNPRTVTLPEFPNAPLLVDGAVGAGSIPLPDEGGRIDAFFNWVDGSGSAGVAALVGVFILASLVMAPTSPMMVAAGAIWGLGRGCVVITVAVFLASSLGFWIGRRAGRNRLLTRFGNRPKFAALDRAFGEEGAKVIFLLRLAPVFPFGVMNYLFGLTGVRYLAYAAATVGGSLPVTLLYTYLGTLKKAGAESPDSVRSVALALAFVALFGGFWFLGKICRKALRTVGSSSGGGAGSGPPATSG